MSDKPNNADKCMIVRLLASEYKTNIQIHCHEASIEDMPFTLSKELDFEVNTAELAEAIIDEITRQETEHNSKE
jgi:hypothetical protein